MNTDTDRIENVSVMGARSAEYMDVFVLPEVGKRVAAFAGYHWKVKSVNKDTQEVVLEQDGMTTAGQRVAGPRQ